jgi:DNA polymerase V
MLLDSGQIDKALDLNELLIKHPAATFFFRVSGKEVTKERICAGDILIVDRSLAPSKGKMVVATIEGELVVKRIDREASDFQIFGVVTHVIHSV